MENLVDSTLPEQMDAGEIDEAMLEMSEFVAQMTEVEGYLYDVDLLTSMQLEKITLSIPIQLDLHVKEDGSVRLGGSPPLYYASTTFLPVFHQININIQLDVNKNSHAVSNE